MAAVIHILVAFFFSKSVAKLIAFGHHLVQRITGNPNFPNPDPPLAQVAANLAALEAAEALAATRAKGTSEARNAKLAIVRNDLRALGGYVQNVAATHPIEERAAVIESSGFAVRKTGSAPKQALSAKMGKGGGVVLRAKAAPKGTKAAYEWQMSSDGGTTWVGIGLTTLATMTVMGLLPATTHVFRVRITIGSTPGPWSQPFTFLVH
jgi:hypothetical protein